MGGEGGAAKEVDPKVEAKRKAKAEAAAAKVLDDYPIMLVVRGIRLDVLCWSMSSCLPQAAAKAAKKKRGLVVGLGVTELRDKVVAITGGDLRTNAVVRTTRGGRCVVGRKDAFLSRRPPSTPLKFTCLYG